LFSNDRSPSQEVQPVVRVTAVTPSGTETGTGFFINIDGWASLVITASHILGGAVSRVDVEMTQKNGAKKSVRATSFAFDDAMLPSTDVAVIALFSSANVEGFPWGTGPAGDFSARVLGHSGMQKTCVATCHQPGAGSVTFFTTDVPIPHGFSGGPMVTDAALLTDTVAGFGVVGLCSEQHLAIDLIADAITACARAAQAHANGRP
jgi:S1-C subfamily serine protease